MNDSVELEALRRYKKDVDIGWTAAMLLYSGELDPQLEPITAEEFITQMQVVMRRAEARYQEAINDKQ